MNINYNTLTNNIWNNVTKHKPMPVVPIAIFMMGLPGSGKSTVIKDFVESNLNMIMKDFIHIDPDIFMRRHEQYDDDHPEEFNKFGVILSSKILKLVFEHKFNFVYYGTGKNYSQYITNINKAKSKGFRTILIHVDVSKEVAKRRARSRKRKVPSKVINNINNALKNKHLKSKKYKNKNNYEILSSLDTLNESIKISNNPDRLI